jgi:hypothetical protein
MALVTGELLERYRCDGCVNVPAVFSPREVETLRDHFMRLRAAGSYPGDTAGVDTGSDDPLKRFPRMIHMHRWDQVSLDWMLDPRLDECMTALLGRSPFAVQTMLYFKPPGARGQALHQDQYYLKAEPGTCMAAWMALDDCDPENGCLQVVAGTHDLPVLCATTADTRVSFTDVTVPVPAGMEVRPVVMRAGDVFFFNGSIIHGSYPNTSRDRFRRALIGHYVAGEAEQVARFYHPALRMDGTEVELAVSEGGGPCGVWTEVDGALTVTLQG